MKKSVFNFCLVKKTILSLSVIAIIVFPSCKKSNSSTDSYHVTCNIDGVSAAFNASTFAHIEYGSGKKAITINGLNNLTPTTGNVGFVITNTPSSDSINTGSYPDTQAKFEVLASYSTNISVSDDYEAGTSTYQEAIRVGSTVANHFTATLTEITSTTVKGTFSGDFYLHGNSKGAKKTITNGDFYVKIQ